MRLISLEKRRLKRCNLTLRFSEPLVFLLNVSLQLRDKSVTAVFRRAHDHVGAFICFVNDSGACFLGVHKSGTYRLLLALHSVKLRLGQAKLFFKLVVFPVKLGIFFNHEIDMLIDFDSAVSP